MENSGKILFDRESSAEWYVAIEGQVLGPLTASDVYERILAGAFTWAHFARREGQTDWKRICDIPPFQAAVPQKPPTAKRQTSRAAPPEVRKAESKRGAVSVVRDWFLYYNESQYGPFSAEEVCRFLSVGKIHPGVYVWKEGMTSWEKLERVAEFRDTVASISTQAKTAPAREARKAEKPSPKEQRAAPRRPLVARILLANESSVIVAVCRDISVGGMQILTDRVPGPTGTRLKVNVSPSGENNRIQPFVAEGIIVRILEDGRGFSFRFERLADNARRSIEEYINSAG